MILYIVFFETNICMYFSCFQLSFRVDFARFNQLFCFLAHLLLFTLLPSLISHTHNVIQKKIITSLYLVLSFCFVYRASTFIAHNSFSSQFCFIIFLLFTSLRLNFHMPLFRCFFCLLFFRFSLSLVIRIALFPTYRYSHRFTLRNFDRILIISLLLSDYVVHHFLVYFFSFLYKPKIQFFFKFHCISKYFFFITSISFIMLLVY